MIVHGPPLAAASDSSTPPLGELVTMSTEYSPDAVIDSTNSYSFSREPTSW
jgi:hypothetical protein